VEVLSEIFILVVKSWSSDLFGHGGLPPPMQLARICRTWRQIASSTPLLWTFIRIVLPTKRLDVYEELIREWIARSAGCPLHLEIFGDDLSPQTCMNNFRPIFTLLLNPGLQGPAGGYVGCEIRFSVAARASHFSYEDTPITVPISMAIQMLSSIAKNQNFNETL